MQAKLCVDENIPIIPIPGPSAFVAALSASALATDEFTFGRFIWELCYTDASWRICQQKNFSFLKFYMLLQWDFFLNMLDLEERG